MWLRQKLASTSDIFASVRDVAKAETVNTTDNYLDYQGSAHNN